MRKTLIFLPLCLAVLATAYGDWSVSEADPSDTIFRSQTGATYHMRICNDGDGDVSIAVDMPPEGDDENDYVIALEADDSLIINELCHNIDVLINESGTSASGTDVQPGSQCP